MKILIPDIYGMFGMGVIPEAKLLTLFYANHFNRVRGSSSQAFGAVARA